MAPPHEPTSPAPASPAPAGDGGRSVTLGRLLAEPGVLQRVVAAGFAWAVTVAAPTFSRAGSGGARALAVLALLAGIAGPVLVPVRRREGRHLGITLFLVACTGAWLLSSAALDPARLDPIRAAVGAVGWGVFAFAWGEPWRLGSDPVDDGGGILRARATLPPLAVPIAGLGVVAALAFLGIAWSVRDGARALAVQAAAVGLSVAVVTTAANVAIERGKHPSRVRSVPTTAVRAIVVLAFVVLVGGVVTVVRR